MWVNGEQLRTSDVHTAKYEGRTNMTLVSVDKVRKIPSLASTHVKYIPEEHLL